jgi:hypothetical protein
MFVLASGTIEEYRAKPGPVDVVFPLEPGAGPDGLLAEASRRIRVLAAMPARSGRERMVASAGAAEPGLRLGDGQGEILALADGRRTPRDLAFALGHGVYATMLQLARMHQAGLLTTVPARAAARGPARPAPVRQASGPSGLPQRQAGTPGLPRRSGQPPAGNKDVRVPGSLLRSRAGNGATTGQVH